MKSDTNKYRNFDVLKVGVTRGWKCCKTYISH
jgi:hypothetical protein